MKTILYKKQLSDFRKWLIDQGYTLEIARGEFEIVRARKPPEVSIIVYRKLKGDVLTTFGEGTKVVMKFLMHKD